MGGENDRPPLIGFRVHGFPKLGASRDVHTGRWLIENQKLWVGQQGEREAQALLLPARAFSDFPVFQFCKSGAAQRLSDGYRVWKCRGEIGRASCRERGEEEG